MKLRVASLLAASAFALLACSSTTTLPDEPDPVVPSTIQQADDKAPPADEDTERDDSEAEADYQIACSRCGPGPQPWHSSAVKIRHHHHHDD